MLKNKSLKIEKFFVIFFLIMAVLSVLMVYSFKTIFNAFVIGYEVSDVKDTKKIILDEEGIGQAYDFIFDKNPTKLDIR